MVDPSADGGVKQVLNLLSPTYRSQCQAGARAASWKCQAGAGATVSSMTRGFTHRSGEYRPQTDHKQTTELRSEALSRA
jgi:hypothetical protein